MKPRFGLLQLFESPGERSQKQYYDENIELVDFADQVGLDEVWLAEHHFSEYGVMPSTQVFGSYIASRTRRVRIGTGVVVLPFHNPIRVAEEFAFLDVLSEGRLDFGVGRGYQPHEFAGYGVPMETSRGVFDESLEVIRMAWSEEEVNFEGEHFRFKGVRPRPKPFQQPHPPIFGASFNPDTIKYQAKKKLNLLFTPLLAPPTYLAEYNAILEEQGEDPRAYRRGGLVFCYVDEDRERAYADFEAPCLWYYRTILKYIPASKYPTSDGYYAGLHDMIQDELAKYDRGETDFKYMVEEGPFQHGFLVGDPASVGQKLDHLLQMYTGLTDVLCWTRLGGLDHKKVMRSMELLVDKVLGARSL